jgi:hypothetical protein
MPENTGPITATASIACGPGQRRLRDLRLVWMSSVKVSSLRPSTPPAALISLSPA